MCLDIVLISSRCLIDEGNELIADGFCREACNVGELCVRTGCHICGHCQGIVSTIQRHISSSINLAIESHVACVLCIIKEQTVTLYIEVINKIM